MKKHIINTVVILIFGAVITVSALSTKNLGADEKKKIDSLTATEAVSAAGTESDTEAADTDDTSKKSADSQKDDAAVAGKKDKSDNKKKSDSLGS